MNTDKLAKVYLDNEPVELVDPKPKVTAILLASDKPKDTSIQWLRSRSDPKGKTLLPEEVVDRTTEPTTPIYLTSVGAGDFDPSDHPDDTAKGGIAPVPKGESGLAREGPEGASDKKPGQVVQQEAEREEPATESGLWADDLDTADDAAADKDD